MIPPKESRGSSLKLYKFDIVREEASVIYSMELTSITRANWTDNFSCWKGVKTNVARLARRQINSPFICSRRSGAFESSIRGNPLKFVLAGAGCARAGRGVLRAAGAARPSLGTR